MEYPKKMNHPQFMPAVVSGYQGRGPNTVKDPPGRAARFPPVWVNNFDQEQYYVSMGYVAEGVTNVEEYRSKTVGDEQPGKPYEHQDFPRWMFRPVEDRVEEALVHTPQEMEQLGPQWTMNLAAARQVANEWAAMLQKAEQEAKLAAMQAAVAAPAPVELQHAVAEAAAPAASAPKRRGRVPKVEAVKEQAAPKRRGRAPKAKV